MNSTEGVEAMRFLTGVALGVLCVSACGSASAQRREQREAQMLYQQLPVVKIEGKVIQVGTGLIQVQDDDGNPQVVKLDPKWTQRVLVSGTAKPSVLRSGMIVAFTTELDQRQLSAKEPLTELQITSADPGNPLGVTSEAADGGGGPYRVVGQVKTFKDGRLTLQADKRQIRAMVADDALLKFEGPDYSYARHGDEIDVQGRLFGQGQVLGETVRVTLSQPIEGEEQPRGRRRGRRGADPAPGAAPTQDPAAAPDPTAAPDAAGQPTP